MDGAPLALEVARARISDTPFRLDLIDEHGTLSLNSGAPRDVQSGWIGLLLNKERVTVGEGELAGLPDPAVNVAGLYARLRDASPTGGSRQSPTSSMRWSLPG